jgi:predicted cation transporter
MVLFFIIIFSCLLVADNQLGLRKVEVRMTPRRNALNYFVIRMFRFIIEDFVFVLSMFFVNDIFVNSFMMISKRTNKDRIHYVNLLSKDRKKKHERTWTF